MESKDTNMIAYAGPEFPGTPRFRIEADGSSRGCKARGFQFRPAAGGPGSLLFHHRVQLAFRQAHVNARSGRRGGCLFYDPSVVGDNRIAAFQNPQRTQL